MKNRIHQNIRFGTQKFHSAALSDIWQLLQGTSVAAQFFAAQRKRNSALENIFLSLAFCTLTALTVLEKNIPDLGGPHYDIIVLPCRRKAHLFWATNDPHAPKPYQRNNANSCIYGNVKYVFV